jgi:hypothetical protein
MVMDVERALGRLNLTLVERKDAGEWSALVSRKH